MSQTRNLTRSMKEIESLYESVLNEKFEHAAMYHDKKDIVPVVNGNEKKETDNLNLDIVDTEELTDKEEKDNAFTPAKFSQNSGKVAKESINNSVMENENIFDKLYKTVMEGEELSETGFQHFQEEDEDAFDDIDSGGEEETVSVQLTPGHVEALLDLLAQVEDQVGDDEEEMPDDIEDFDSGDEDDDSLLSEGRLTNQIKAGLTKLGVIAGGVLGAVAFSDPKVRTDLKTIADRAKVGFDVVLNHAKKIVAGAAQMSKGDTPKGEAVDAEEVDYDESLLNPKGSNKVGNVTASGGTASTGDVDAGDGKLKAAPDGKKLAGLKSRMKVKDLKWG